MWLVVLALAGCGGVDSGGTGAPLSSAGGPITGFGSVIVNGVHFDDSSASVTDADGTAHSRDELQLGMTTEIKGSPIAVTPNGSVSTATSIVFGSAILGPIDSIDAVARTVVVLGQTVDIKATTVFDNNLNGGLAALSVGDVVEVYALFDAAHTRYNATRIERKASVSAYRLRGVVSNLDSANKSFDIGGERISYAALAASDVPATLANGHIVRVRLLTTPVSGAWVATRLRDGVRQLEDRDDTSVEGLISDFTSNAQFSVEGVSVDASQAVFTAGTSGLGLGARVAVKGSASGGVLVASEVQVKTDTDVENDGFELDGTISAIDIAGKTFVVRGITVDYSGTVDFRDGTVSDLASGKIVEVRGTLSADGTRLLAVRITFRL